MKTSDHGRKFIEQWEGAALKAYWDGYRAWTIGFGHTSAAGPPAVHPGMIINSAQADEILSADLGAVENNVNLHVRVPLNQNQFDALVSFDFNTGALDRSSLLRAINALLGSNEIEHDFMMWDHSAGKFVQGLYNRRIAEFKLFAMPVIVPLPPKAAADK